MDGSFAYWEHLGSLYSESDYNRERFAGEADTGECLHMEATLLSETETTQTWECQLCGLVEVFEKGGTL